VGPTDDPFTAGLEHVVRLDKEFLGIEAVRVAKDAARPHRLVSQKLDDPEPILLHGESVIAEGRIAGAVMSGAYAHTLGAAAGLAMMESSVISDEESTVQVDIAGLMVKATLSPRPFYDPSGSRMRA
jgi:glycine cleavage system aminomethyltransferase T